MVQHQPRAPVDHGKAPFLGQAVFKQDEGAGGKRAAAGVFRFAGQDSHRHFPFLGIEIAGDDDKR